MGGWAELAIDSLACKAVPFVGIYANMASR